MNGDRTLALVEDLRKSGEADWIEFKVGNEDPERIGRYISALSNSARYSDQPFAYILWGIRDSDRAVVGTTFEPGLSKHKNQPLELWLAERLNPDVAFSFKVIDHPDGRLVLLEIPASTTAPVEFDRQAYIRIGSATPRLSDYSERQRQLWLKLQPFAWETGIARQFVSGDTVLALLDHTAYFRLTSQPLPDNRIGIFDRLQNDRIIAADVGGNWNITRMGAILFAYDLNTFGPEISRKAVRFTAYDGNSRASIVTHRQEEKRGYAAGFEAVRGYIDAALPRNEHIGAVFREEHPLFPSIAIRELLANALIHQDMTITGAGPLVELFRDRMEITNPGTSLIKPERFIDSAPRSRNETMAQLMRRMNICEEQGSGIDKVIRAVEIYQLPPPDFRIEENATRAILFAPKPFSQMTADERIRACYQHAVLKHLSGERMKNSTLRERLGIDPKNSAQVSQVIGQTRERGLIRSADPQRPKSAYVPYWA